MKKVLNVTIQEFKGHLNCPYFFGIYLNSYELLSFSVNPGYFCWPGISELPTIKTN